MWRSRCRYLLGIGSPSSTLPRGLPTEDPKNTVSFQMEEERHEAVRLKGHQMPVPDKGMIKMPNKSKKTSVKATRSGS